MLALRFGGASGCFIIWRRLAYFGDTLSHSALPEWRWRAELNITLSVFAISVCVSLLLMMPSAVPHVIRYTLAFWRIPLAVGLVVLAFMTWVRVDLMGFLFGDILSITVADLAIGMYVCVRDDVGSHLAFAVRGHRKRGAGFRKVNVPIL